MSTVFNSNTRSLNSNTRSGSFYQPPALSRHLASQSQVGADSYRNDAITLLSFLFEISVILYLVWRV